MSPQGHTDTNETVREYLNDVAKSLGNEYITRQFGYSLDSDSAAKALASARNAGAMTTHGSTSTPIILPFRANIDQLEAIERALNHRISVIEGPPGTGKTQTILNLVANLLARGQTVLIASPNNSATANVVDKLRGCRVADGAAPASGAHAEALRAELGALAGRKGDGPVDIPADELERKAREYRRVTSAGLGFFVAELGNAANEKVFRTCPPTVPPDFERWHRSPAETHALESEIAGRTEAARKTFAAKLEAGRARKRADDARAQLDYLEKLCDPSPTSERLRVRRRAAPALERLYAFRREVSALDDRQSSEAASRLPWTRRLWWAIVGGGVGPYRVLGAPAADMEAACDLRIYQEERNLAEAEQTRLEGVASEEQATRNVAELERLSMEYLLARLHQLYPSSGRLRADGTRKVVNRLEPKDLAKDTGRGRGDGPPRSRRLFEEGFPVATSTVHAARNTCPQSNGEPEEAYFDWVIIDESSQCPLDLGYLALSAAKNAVIVGDTKQLPPVKDAAQDSVAEEVGRRHPSIPPEFRWQSHSLLSCAEVRCESWGGDARTTLREHYRCARGIISFCNEEFYDGELVVMTGDEAEFPIEVELAPRGAEYLDPKDGDGPRGLVNKVQAEEAYNAAKRLAANDDEAHRIGIDDIGVITPYKTQADFVWDQKKRAEELGMGQLRCSTVHAYQGRERDGIIYMLTRDRLTRFNNDPKLTNVAVSRAKRRLVIIGNGEMLRAAAGKGKRADGPIGALYGYVVYHHGEVRVAEARLAFPLIYSAERAWGPGESPAEDGAREMVEQALREAKLPADGAIDVMHNYPLSLFVPADLALTHRQRSFIRNGAHVDFAIYDRATMQVLAGLEINGSHHKTRTQRERDDLKKAIFKEMGIPLTSIWTKETELMARRQIAELVDAAASRRNRARFVPDGDNELRAWGPTGSGVREEEDAKADAAANPPTQGDALLEQVYRNSARRDARKTW